MPFDGKEYTNTTARRMLALLGDNGERWAQGAFLRNGGFCLVGAYFTAMGRSLSRLNFNAMNAAIARIDPDHGKYSIGDWNDDPARTFADIKLVLEYMHEAEIAAMSVAAE